MQIIFLDGESKSGKTAVGRSIEQALAAQGYSVRLLVAGNFFRQLTTLALQQVPDITSRDQTTIEAVVAEVLKDEQLLRPPKDVDSLNAPAVEATVSLLARLPQVQSAAVDWRLLSAQQALEDSIDILLFDGRNLRQKLKDWTKEHDISICLELVIYCQPEVAALRYLRDEGTAAPDAPALARAAETIAARRQNDRERAQAAYVDPVDPVTLIVGTHSVDEALATAWAADVTDPPRPIRFDNSEVPREDGLNTVTELALAAVARLQS